MTSRPASAARRCAVTAAAARALHAERLDIVTERLDGEPFDLIIATNILPYFDDTQLALAMTNIAAMLAPGGAFCTTSSAPSWATWRWRSGCRSSSHGMRSSPR